MLHNALATENRGLKKNQRFFCQGDYIIERIKYFFLKMGKRKSDSVRDGNAWKDISAEVMREWMYEMRK
jgi:hypothetical protein